MRADGLATPILFLTAKDALDDKVAGLHGRRRRLRDQAVLAGRDRHAGAGDLCSASARRPADDHARLTFADVVLDSDTHEVWRAGAPIELTATEFNLLHFFMLNPRRVLSKPQILDHVWHYDFDGDSNILETYVSYLRRKLNGRRPAVDPHRPPGRLRAARARSTRPRCRCAPGWSRRRASSRSSRWRSPVSPRTPPHPVPAAPGRRHPAAVARADRAGASSDPGR